MMYKKNNTNSYKYGVDEFSSSSDHIQGVFAHRTRREYGRPWPWPAWETVSVGKRSGVSAVRATRLWRDYGQMKTISSDNGAEDGKRDDGGAAGRRVDTVAPDYSRHAVINIKT